MVADWVLEELADVDLGDKRRNRRLLSVVSDLAEHPTASIPAACGGHADMAAAYRLFENDAVSPEAILRPHAEKTLARVAAQKVALFVQDTTEGDLTRPRQQVAGAGPLGGSSRRGFFLHPLGAFTPEGVPLGTLWAEMWARDEASLTIPPTQKREQRRQAPIDEKESQRWLTGLRQARAAAGQCPDTQCVCMADSEADIYEVFAEPRGDTSPVHWLIRLCQDRALRSSSGGEEADESHRRIREALLAAPVLLTYQIAVRGRKAKVACEERSRRQPRQDRRATAEVRARAVTLRPPHRPGAKLPEITVNVVLVSEVQPPTDDVPVEWLLATTLPIEAVEEVQAVIAYYCIRWLIGVFFRTLKSGCRVESRLFETLDRERRCLAVYLVVAWRVLFICRMGRGHPDLDCEAIFEPAEWKAVWVAVTRKPLPKTPPRLQEMVRLIAQLGGYVNRPNRSDPPGPQTLWLGLQRMHDLALAWELFGPGTRRKDV